MGVCGKAASVTKRWKFDRNYPNPNRTYNLLWSRRRGCGGNRTPTDSKHQAVPLAPAVRHVGSTGEVAFWPQLTRLLPGRAERVVLFLLSKILFDIETLKDGQSEQTCRLSRQFLEPYTFPSHKFVPTLASRLFLHLAIASRRLITMAPKQATLGYVKDSQSTVRWVVF